MWQVECVSQIAQRAVLAMGVLAFEPEAAVEIEQECGRRLVAGRGMLIVPRAAEVKAEGAIWLRLMPNDLEGVGVGIEPGVGVGLPLGIGRLGSVLRRGARRGGSVLRRGARRGESEQRVKVVKGERGGVLART